MGEKESRFITVFLIIIGSLMMLVFPSEPFPFNLLTREIGFFIAMMGGVFGVAYWTDIEELDWVKEIRRK